MNRVEPFPSIRLVTPQSLDRDLREERLMLPPLHADALRDGALGYSADFWVAHTKDKAQYPRGQIGVYWNAPLTSMADSRAALGLQDGETVPSIVSLEVPEPYRRHGIGRALLRTVMRAASDEGRDKVSLDVASDNVLAIRFYLLEGFRAAGLQRPFSQYVRIPDKTYEVEEIVADLMVKDLRPAASASREHRW